MSYHFCFLKEHDAQKSKLFYYVKVMWTLEHVPFWMFLFQFSVGILSVPSVNFKVTRINKTRNMKRAKQTKKKKNLKAKKQWENERKLVVALLLELLMIFYQYSLVMESGLWLVLESGCLPFFFVIWLISGQRVNSLNFKNYIAKNLYLQSI